MKREGEREREIVSDSFLSLSLSLCTVSGPQYLLFILSCLLGKTHACSQSNIISSLSIKSKVLDLQQCYWK